jgi:hypothetical protein
MNFMYASFDLISVVIHNQNQMFLPPPPAVKWIIHRGPSLAQKQPVVDGSPHSFRRPLQWKVRKKSRNETAFHQGGLSCFLNDGRAPIVDEPALGVIRGRGENPGDEMAERVGIRASRAA